MSSFVDHDTTLLMHTVPTVPPDRFTTGWQQQQHCRGLPSFTGSDFTSNHIHHRVEHQQGFSYHESRPYRETYGEAHDQPGFSQWAIDFPSEPSWPTDMGTPSNFDPNSAEEVQADMRNSPRIKDELLCAPDPEAHRNSPSKKRATMNTIIEGQVDAFNPTRPPISRSVTAPQTRQRSHDVHNSDHPALRRNHSDSTEEEYAPSDSSKGRGRKRQRIPHTAVERRYRENLNAHLDKLRQAVPSMKSRRAENSAKAMLDGATDAAKPSKCEILNGAIEWIQHLDHENQGLKNDNAALSNRLADLERWYSSYLKLHSTAG